MTRKLIALLSAATLAAGATAISGCSADDATGVDPAQAAQTTAAKKTAKIAMTMKLTGLGLGDASVDLNGVMDLQQPRGRFTLDFGKLVEGMGMPKGLFGSDTDIQAQFQGGQVDVELPDIPALQSKLNGKHWVHLDLGELAKGFGIDTKGLGALMAVTPGDQLKLLDGIAGLKKSGTEKIDGADTTHYAGSTTAKAFLDKLPAAKREAFDKAMKQLQSLGSGAAPKLDDVLGTKQDVDMWVDGDGLVRQMRLSAKLPTGGMMAKDAGYEMTYKLSDFGTKLEFASPAASDTYTVTSEAIQSLMSMAGAGAGLLG